VGAVQIILIILYTLFITIFIPHYWLEPFGSIVKNIPLFVSTLMMMAMADLDNALFLVKTNSYIICNHYIWYWDWQCFYMYRAHLSADDKAIAFASRNVVIADWFLQHRPLSFNR